MTTSAPAVAAVGPDFASPSRPWLTALAGRPADVPLPGGRWPEESGTEPAGAPPGQAPRAPAGAGPPPDHRSGPCSFVILLAAVVVGAFAAVRWYDTNSYFVRVNNNELVIYQGRIGGFLWYHPVEVRTRTGVTTADVPASYLSSLSRPGWRSRRWPTPGPT